jgi:type IV pilus assembly protein PilM
MSKPSIPTYFSDKPIMGLDIGSNTLKIVQLSETASKSISSNRLPAVKGYGYVSFDKSAIQDGMIVKPEEIASAAKELLANKIKGKINTNRVAMAVPAYRTFTRSVKLPALNSKQVKEAVELEAEQYISLGLEELYLDYEIIKEAEESMEVFLVAVPKKIADSYMQLAELLELEVVALEPTLSASARLFSIDKHSRQPAVIIDFGAFSSDISIYDRGIVVSGTIEGGGVNFTDLIKNLLNISEAEAELAKTRYGITPSKKQGEIKKALDPTLQKIIKEIKRMLRYYEERYGSDRPITQIVTFGGGANMPGLSDYLTDNLRMAVRHGDPWQFIDCKKVDAPISSEKSMYTNALGSALLSAKEATK